MLDMKRRRFIALVGGAGLVLAGKVRLAPAQQPAVPVIGFLNSQSPGGYPPWRPRFTRACAKSALSRAGTWRSNTAGLRVETIDCVPWLQSWFAVR
jgi:hypothetical protein